MESENMAYNSNKIEGSTLTSEQTASLFDTGTLYANEESFYRAKDIEEMNGHFKMFNEVLKTLDVPLTSERRIRDMLQENKKIEYVQGIRGICCLWSCLFHFLLAFLPYGYVGWGSGIEIEMQQAEYFSFYPYSVCLNSSFLLYLLISLIGFTISCRYFRTEDLEFLKKQAEKRYLRLMLPVLSIILISYAIYAFSLNYNIVVGEYIHNPWLVACSYSEPISLLGAIFSGLFRVFFLRDGDYCAVLWCYHIIFLGSFMVYGFLALLGTSKKRYVGYLLLSIGLWYTGNTLFLCLVSGMIAADIVVNYKSNSKEKSYLEIMLVTIGILFGAIPVVLLPSGIDESMVVAIGITLVLIGIEKNQFIQKFLSRKVLVAAGKYSSSIVLVHFCVLVSITCWVYYEMEMKFGYSWLSLIMAFVTYVISTYVFVRLFYRWIEYPLLKFANKLIN